ncbi:hypothetical protein MTO96_002919 [Rhipicephalus appendiculatus]
MPDPSKQHLLHSLLLSFGRAETNPDTRTCSEHNNDRLGDVGRRSHATCGAAAASAVSCSPHRFSRSLIVALFAVYCETPQKKETDHDYDCSLREFERSLLRCRDRRQATADMTCPTTIATLSRPHSAAPRERAPRCVGRESPATSRSRGGCGVDADTPRPNVRAGL